MTPRFSSLLFFLAGTIVAGLGAQAIPVAGSLLPASKSKVITASDASGERIGRSIPTEAIGEPVSAVTLKVPRWVDSTVELPAHVVVDGSMAPIDPKAKPIHFRVLLPATWSCRAAQLGGGGFNGVIPSLAQAEYLRRGFATYGSDSGHQAAQGHRGETAAEASARDDWALNDEVARNFGYMQMKKTHDAAMVIIERMYGERPRFNYYIGTSQGGREALTVAQRYPADYDGVAANVPVVSLSTLMLAPVLLRIHEVPQAAWVTPAKTKAIAQEFIRQADKLDGLSDGVINNYVAARALFDMSQGDAKRNPWAALRAPNGVDPDPKDASSKANLTDAQIETLKFTYSRYALPKPLANGVTSFGMWIPNTDPAGFGTLQRDRFRGQEGADAGALVFTSIGVLGVTGFMMQDLSANPLDFNEQRYATRRALVSEWMDSTNPDLSAFYRRGGKLIVVIGTNDMLASSGAQLDYYQSVIDKMGRDTVDAFARLWVLPQTGHGLTGKSYETNGNGDAADVFDIPNTFDRIGMITAWVENNEAPEKTIVVTSGDRSLPMCSYPEYPRYVGGPRERAASYRSTAP